MKITVKFVAVLLLLVMISSTVVACNVEEPSKDTESETVSNTVDTENSHTLPVMNLGGEEYNILGRDHPNYIHLDNFEIAHDELPEDVVGQAVYNRNRTDYSYQEVHL